MRATVGTVLEEAAKATQLILITHRVEEVLPMFTHAASLREGKLHRQGPTSELVPILSSMDHAKGAGDHASSVACGGTEGSAQSLLPSTSPTAAFLRQYQQEAESRAKSLLHHEPAALPRSIIDVNRATVTYEGRDILKAVSWHVGAGENWAITGPNGSGKSTLVRLAYADHPQMYSNDVSVLGRRRGDPGVSIWDLRRHVGVVTPYLHLEHSDKAFSTFEVVLSGFFDSVGLWQKPSKNQAFEAAKWAHWLGIDQLMDRPFLGLSQGEQRLALLARAMVKRPKILLLDEPTHGLDTPNRRHFLSWVDAIGLSGDCSVVCVTHHRDEMVSCISHELRLTQDGCVESSGLVNK